MKSFNIKPILILFPFLLVSLCLQAQDDRYAKRIERYTSFWEKLIPRYTKLQFAGSMGMLSVGTGWNYGKDHWETDFLLGLVPRNSDRHAMATITLKQNYIPWHIPLHERFSLEPLTCGLYINTLLDKDFWVRNPDRYPNGYYTFSTRVRTHIFVGQRITLNLKSKKRWNKSISLFYELSTCDLYLISAATNHYLKPRDYLSLSFGAKFQIL